MRTDATRLSILAYKADDYAADNAERMAGEVDRFAASLQPCSVILDAGCGPGRDLARFEALDHVAVGVDLNPDFLTMARSAGLHVEEADLRQLPFDDSTFDGVWACASLVHLDPEQSALALAELCRVSRHGAKLYASVKITGTTGWQETRHGLRYFEMWKPETFAAAIESAGFTVSAIEPGPVFVDVWADAS